MTMLFAVDGASATPAPGLPLSALGLMERQHLQEWVLAHPHVLGDDVMIITSEFDRWEDTDGAPARDRLDILGLDTSGRLVVVELKRGDSGSDVHLQAITYAALVSRFELETLADAHQQFRARRGESLTNAEATARVLEHVDGQLDTDMLSAPRLVLIAGSFPKQVTHTAVWLAERGLDVTLIQVSTWRVGEQVLAGFSRLFPTPGSETFTLAPQRAEAREVTRKAAERGRAGTATSRLIQANLLADGAVLHLVPSSGTTADVRAAIDVWVAQDPRRGSATWSNNPSAPLIWAADGNAYRPTTLAQKIMAEAAGKSGSIRGPAWWVTDDDVDLAALADGAAAGSRRDWTDLHTILETLPAGTWTTYGDLATVLATAAQPVGNHIARCPVCVNAHRVLSANGRAAVNFAWGDPSRMESPEGVLRTEGVTFTSGVADAARRLGPDRLRALGSPTA